MTSVLYTKERQQEWDAFVDASKNGTFMLKRGYMDYHSDRFIDSSLMFYQDDRLVAVLPASRHGDEIRSHGGLTYGGMVCGRDMTASLMLEVFEAMKSHLKQVGVKNLIYKRVPAIYYGYPADEDLYALFRNDAELCRCDLSTAIWLDDPIPCSSIRKRWAQKAAKNGLCVRESDDYGRYIDMLTDILAKYHNTKPPHTADEIRLLVSRFPDVIKLFCAYRGEEMLAGVLVFDTKRVVHAQYIANSDEGRKIGALDLVMDYLIHTYSAGRKFFDFGISTEANGTVLNCGLINQKETFGGRGVIYNHYKLEI